MKLSRDEELFLRHWMHDECAFATGGGSAKRLQVMHRVPPADLAALVAAALPDPNEQARAAAHAPTEPPAWPWTETALRARLAEARAVLAARALPQSA
jgi:hypothetical protein